MAAEYDYVCNRCGKSTQRNLLTVKKVLFTEMGAGGSTTRGRVIGWFCPDCVRGDPDWNRPAHIQPNQRMTPNLTIVKQREDPDA